MAGHSVGELAAAALAGVLPALDAVDLAAVRGQAMSAACALTPTGMSAVMGGDVATVLSTLAELDLVGANVNGGGQIVAAGTADALAALAADPPAGTRVIALPVAGAFHTSYMASAEADRRRSRAGDQPGRPAAAVADQLRRFGDRRPRVRRTFLQLLVAQVTRPVRWDLCMPTLAHMGVTGVLELPPAGTLVGLVKRELKGVATLALKTPAGPGRRRRHSSPSTRECTGERAGPRPAINRPAGPPGTRISGLGHFRPDTVVTNDDLAQIMDTNDEWIRSRVGIAERRFAGEDDTVISMGARASAKAIAEAGISPTDIDTVIVATCTLESPVPHAATQIAGALGIHAPRLVRHQRGLRRILLRRRRRRPGDPGRAPPPTVLVVGSERLTAWTDPKDRANGDHLRRRRRGGSGQPAADEAEIGPVVWGSDETHIDAIRIEGRNGTLLPGGPDGLPLGHHEDRPGRDPGRARRPGSTWPTSTCWSPTRRTCGSSTPSPRRSSRPAPGRSCKVGRDIVTSGNTSSASIPLALDRMRAAGEVSSGRRRAVGGLRRRPDLRGPGVPVSPEPPARRRRLPLSRPRRAACGRTAPGTTPAASDPENGKSPPKGTTVSNEDIIAGLGEIVEEVAGVAAADVTVEKSFTDDLDIDSLSMVEIAVQAEDKFGVKIPDDELANLKTVGDAVAYIEANQA